MSDLVVRRRRAPVPLAPSHTSVWRRLGSAALLVLLLTCVALALVIAVVAALGFLWSKALA